MSGILSTYVDLYILIDFKKQKVWKFAAGSDTAVNTYAKVTFLRIFFQKVLGISVIWTLFLLRLYS